MFNLDQAIVEWRRQMLAAGIKAPVPLEELESHLQDDVQEKVRSGLDEQEAFATAVRQMGHAGILQNEFIKTRAGFGRRWQRLIVKLIGIPNYQLATNMNTTHSTPNLETRRASYLKAAALALPAALIWMLAVIFVMPKLQEICQQTGRSMFTFNNAPVVIQAFAWVGHGLFLLTQYRLPVGMVLLAILVLLEWRSARWPRYRRAVLGTGAFLLNFAVLITISVSVVSALLVAMQHLPNVK